jgi:hypothetical protein
MFTQAWKKYLPVIVILLKRSLTGEQKLSMNASDFQRAAGGRKVKFAFNDLQMNNGRIVNGTTKHSPFTKEFAQLLQEDVLTAKLIRTLQVELSMNNRFELLIVNKATQEVAADEEAITEEVAIIETEDTPQEG